MKSYGGPDVDTKVIYTTIIGQFLFSILAGRIPVIPFNTAHVITWQEPTFFWSVSAKET